MSGPGGSGWPLGDPPPGTAAGVRSALVRLAVTRGRVAQAMSAAVAAGEPVRDLEGLAHEMLVSTDAEIRRVGALALGQLAPRGIDRERALRVLRGLLLDPSMGAVAGESLGQVLNHG
ncbi:hypothetical protein [Phytomonospora endophytica]|uniref:HEAT repeat domain-containing protein n=1 Tax=Phytomonospora endophytica TaxID=714109 RepID=A0A841FFU7_9ACTN|nr:hypothetical protein [Phytomonospora endophytica]MBB6033873.1 hypothetical protein [Phytomonospora endophytica]GIG64607.1 hypothetical protein Pen01_09020 [Phytomonospora endophytica]